jgi:RNA polymerase-binding transcription factor DksA
LTEVDTQKVEARLRERAEEIARSRANLADGVGGGQDSELSDYDQHPADQGSETFQQELDETTEMLLAEEARQVEIAQQRLAAGEYGKCVDCGKEIPAARLEAVPEAVRCIDDQQRYEGMLRERGGPPQSAA